MDKKKSIEVYVFPRMAMEGMKYDDDMMVISIVSPNVVHPVIRAKHVYQFHFHDVTEEYQIDSGVVRPMEYAIAEQIAEVAIRHRDKKEWIIHCEAGISRSPGVAIGLSRYIDLFPGTDLLCKMYPHHNLHVRKYVEKALREKLKAIGEDPYATY